MLVAEGRPGFFHLFFETTVGRKVVMAVTGLAALAFLLGHLAGNALVFKGAETYNGYAHGLHAFPLLWPVRLVLGLLFVTHIGLAIALVVQNLAARPLAYAVRASAGRKTLASSTMIYSGALILAFVCYHVWTMRSDPGEAGAAFERVNRVLGDPWVAAAYLCGLAAVGLHLLHGGISMLMTFGARHPRYDALADLAGRALALVLAAGFAAIVFWVQFGGPPHG